MVTLSSEKLRVAIRYESYDKALQWLEWWGRSMGLVKLRDHTGTRSMHVHFMDKLEDLGIDHPDRYQHWTWLLEERTSTIYK